MIPLFLSNDGFLRWAYGRRIYSGVKGRTKERCNELQSRKKVLFQFDNSISQAPSPPTTQPPYNLHQPSIASLPPECKKRPLLKTLPRILLILLRTPPHPQPPTFVPFVPFAQISDIIHTCTADNLPDHADAASSAATPPVGTTAAFPANVTVPTPSSPIFVSAVADIYSLIPTDCEASVSFLA